MSSGQGPGPQENGIGHVASSETQRQAPKPRTVAQRFLGGLNNIAHAFSRNRQVENVEEAQRGGDTGIAALSGQETSQRESRDITSFVREQPHFAELPSAVKLPQQIIDGARFLMAHTLYDETILGERLDASGVEGARPGNLNEAATAIIKREGGVIDVSQVLVEIGGKEEDLGYSVDLEAALQRSKDAGEDVVGSMHSHPYLVGESIYEEAMNEPPTQPVSEHERELGDQFVRTQFETTPPSVADIAISAEERRPFDIVVANKRLYCIIPTVETPDVVKTEEELMEEHDRMRQVFKQERKRLTELGQKPTDAEVERMILTTLEEYCRQFNLGFYAIEWDSKAPPQELVLNRVTA